MVKELYEVVVVEKRTVYKYRTKPECRMDIEDPIRERPIVAGKILPSGEVIPVIIRRVK